MSMTDDTTTDATALDGAEALPREPAAIDEPRGDLGAADAAKDVDDREDLPEPAEDDRIIYLRVDSLDHDPKFNVRTASAKFPGDDEDRKLIDSIDKRGLLESLIVRPNPDVPGRWMVPGGDRRRRSLGVIAGRKRGRYKPHSVVPCLRRDENATSASFDENTLRKAMHPADWLRACQRLIDAEGLSVAGLAKRLRQSETDIRRHLALANLHPRILAAFAADRIGIDAARAYAGSPDPERQIVVFERLSESKHAGTAHLVRGALDDSAVALDSGLMKFVGRDDYEKAGGRIEVDLFGNEADGRAVDVDLLDQLTDAKLGAARDAHADGWAWATAVRPDGMGFKHECARMPSSVVVPAEVAAELDGAEREADERAEQLWELEDENVDGNPEAEDGYRARLAEAKALADAANERVRDIERRIAAEHTSVPPELRAVAGVIVSFNRWSGEVEVHEGLIRPEDAQALDEWRRGPGAEGGPAADAFGTRGGTTPTSSGPSSFERDMGRARRQAIRAALADEPETALLLVQFETALHHFHPGFGRRALQRVVGPAEGGEPADVADMAGSRHLDERRADFDTSWIRQTDDGYSLDREASAAAFVELDAAERARMFAYCVARGLTGGDPTDTGAVLPETFATRIATDVARWWRPTRTAYFDRLTKEELTKVGVEWYGDAFRRQHAKSKRQPLRDALARVFEVDESELTEHERTVRATWLPASMA